MVKWMDGWIGALISWVTSKMYVCLSRILRGEITVGNELKYFSIVGKNVSGKVVYRRRQQSVFFFLFFAVLVFVSQQVCMFDSFFCWRAIS